MLKQITKIFLIHPSTPNILRNQTVKQASMFFKMLKWPKFHDRYIYSDSGKTQGFTIFVTLQYFT